jgi:hypothetical protein
LSAGFFLVIDNANFYPALSDDETGVQFFDGPGRRETAGSHQLMAACSQSPMMAIAAPQTLPRRAKSLESHVFAAFLLPRTQSGIPDLISDLRHLSSDICTPIRPARS